MKKIKISTSCPKTLIKQSNAYISRGYQALSEPTVFFDCNTKKVSYHLILYKKLK